jgi:hypothetical protein
MKSKSTNGKACANASKRDPNRYPKGLTRRRVQGIIAHYESQTEDQVVAEDEAAYYSNRVTMMGVPVDLVPPSPKAHR